MCHVINNKIIKTFCTVLLLFNVQCTNALISNAKTKQLLDQEAANKSEAQKQDCENNSSTSQPNTYSTTHTPVPQPQYETNTGNINSVDQITFCATRDYEKTKMRSEIFNLQKNNLLLQEKNKNSTALASANFDLEKSKLRENNRIDAIRREEMINNNIKTFVAVDNNVSQERNEKIWYRKIFNTSENYGNYN